MTEYTLTLTWIEWILFLLVPLSMYISLYYGHKLLKYLKENKKDFFETLLINKDSKRFWSPVPLHDFQRMNPLKAYPYLFWNDSQDDEKSLYYKKRFRVLFFIAVISLIIVLYRVHTSV